MEVELLIEDIKFYSIVNAKSADLQVYIKKT